MRIKTVIYHSVLFSAISLVGVGMVAMSNLTTPLLPDIYDPSRPEDTWSCCMTMVTTHPWRWPLFLIGNGLLVASTVWGVFYLHRGLRQLVKQTPSKKTPLRSWHKPLELAMMVTPIVVAVMISGAIGTLIMAPAYRSDHGFFQWMQLLPDSFITIAWIATLLYGCLIVPIYSFATRARWRAKQLHVARWRKTQRPVAILQVVSLVTFVPLVWLMVSYFMPPNHAATSYGRYPLDILMRPLGGWDEVISLFIIWGLFLILTTVIAFMHFFASSHPRQKRRSTTTLAPTDMPS